MVGSAARSRWPHATQRHPEDMRTMIRMEPVFDWEAPRASAANAALRRAPRNDARRAVAAAAPTLGAAKIAFASLLVCLALGPPLGVVAWFALTALGL